MTVLSTIKDVAKLAETSIATVSRFLNGERVKEINKQKITQAIAELDYKIDTYAKGLKMNKTYTIGYIVPDLTNAFFARIAQSAQNYLCDYGYSLIVLSSNDEVEQESRLIQYLLDRNVDGIMISSSSPDIDMNWLNNVMNKKPVLFIDRKIPGLQMDVVLVDNVNGAYQATELLIQQGHTKIAIINGPQSLFTGEERYKGYLRAFEDYGLVVEQNLVKFGDFHAPSGYENMLKILLGEPAPSAVFVTNYYMAIGAIMAINEQNIKIPQELSFISFDDLELSKVHQPPLTTIVQPMDEIGEKASQLLLERLVHPEQRSSPIAHRLKTKLVTRNSIQNINKLPTL